MTPQTATHRHHAALHHDPLAAANAEALREQAELRELKRVQKRHVRAYVAGRALLGLIFIVGAVAKAATFGATEAAMSDYGFQLTGLLLVFAIAIEGVAGAMLVVGYKVRGAALALGGWLCTVTVIVHGNLGIEANRVSAITNGAIIAGLLLLYAHGAGNASLDRRAAARAAKESLRPSSWARTHPV